MKGAVTVYIPPKKHEQGYISGMTVITHLF